MKYVYEIFWGLVSYLYPRSIFCPSVAIISSYYCPIIVSDYSYHDFFGIFLFSFVYFETLFGHSESERMES